MFTFVHIDSGLIKHCLPHVFYGDRFKQQHHNDRANYIHGESVAYCGMSNASSYKGREAHAGSDSTPQKATLLQNGHPRKNGLDLHTATIPRPPTPNSYSLPPPPPIIPPFHSSSFSEAPKKNGLDFPTTIPLLPTPNSYSQPPPPIIPPFHSSSFSEAIENPSSISLNNDHTYKNHCDLPTNHHPPQSKNLPSIIPPIEVSLTSTSKANSSYTLNPPHFCHPPLINRNTPNLPHQMKSCRNPPYVNGSCHAIDRSVSTGPSLNSNFPSAVKSSVQFNLCAAPGTMPISHTPFHGPVDLNPSTESTTSSLTSSYQTNREGLSALHFANYSHSSLLPHSKDGYGISTPDSNLMSHYTMGGGDSKPPDMLFLPSDFLPIKKKQIDKNHANKIWSYAAHFDRSLPETNPNDSQVEQFLSKINMLYEEINDILTKFLLSHLTVGYNILLRVH